MKKQQKKVQNEFNTPLFLALKKVLLPFVGSDMSKEERAKIAFEKYHKFKGLYFAVFQCGLPAPKNRLAICLNDYFDMDLALKGIFKWLKRKPERQGTGDVFLKQMDALNFTNLKYDVNYWKATREKVIPWLEESLSSELKVKLSFYAVINENDAPIILLEDEKTGDLHRVKTRLPDKNESISAKFSHHGPISMS